MVASRHFGFFFFSYTRAIRRWTRAQSLFVRELILGKRKENQKPGSLNEQNIKNFGNEIRSGSYFGGPIFLKSRLQWQDTFFTRAAGDVIGARESGIPLPPKLERIVRNVGVMRSNLMTQTCFWIGPRLLMSTLHFHDWIQGYPSSEECQLIIKSGRTFDVENEISAQTLSQYSLKVRLLAYSADDDIGFFGLLEEYPSRTEFVDPGWLMERDVVYNQDLSTGRAVACVGYSSRVHQDDARRIKEEAARQLQTSLQQVVTSVSLFHFNTRSWHSLSIQLGRRN